MNILTFDVEEWYLEKGFSFFGNHENKYQQFDDVLDNLLDLLDEKRLKATFFCVGKLATEFPNVVRRIAARGHEVGCHSNEHIWLDKMDEDMVRRDTNNALNSLEDIYGNKVISYRAPAFSVTEENKWVFEVLAECGIENDASIFPASRDFGGFPSFPKNFPCVVNYNGSIIKEFPVYMTSAFGKRFAYSGGGYFRLLPYWYVSKIIKKNNYNICYFHLKDLMKENVHFLSKNEYEDYFKQSGSLINRIVRYVKDNISGGGDMIKKLSGLLDNNTFVNVRQAAELTDWTNTSEVFL